MTKEYNIMNCFLSILYPVKDVLEENLIIDKVLSEAKTERKGKNIKNIKTLGLNIYRYKDYRVSDLIEEAINKKLLIITGFTGKGRRFEFSNDAIEGLSSYWTKAYCDTYREFYLKVKEMFNIEGVAELPDITIMFLFHTGNTIKSIHKEFIENSNNQSTRYHLHIINEFAGISNQYNNNYIFHFSPKLFLPMELQKKKVHLTITGIDTPTNMIISKPFANKSFCTIGFRKENEISNWGIYPIIAKREEFPEKLLIHLKWEIEGGIQLLHNLHIEFEFLSRGYFFSTDQVFSRPVYYKEFNLVSSFTKGDTLANNRELFYRPKTCSTITEIEEFIRLSNFPVNLHSLKFAGPHYKKWVKE